MVNRKWQSVVQLGASFMLLWLQVRWLPHYNDLVNKIRAASYTLVLFCAMTFVLLSFKPGIKDASDPQQVSFQLQCAATAVEQAGVRAWPLRPVR